VENRLLVSSYESRDMLDPQKTSEREALLKRIRELDAEIAQHEHNMREGEVRLPVEEQLSLKLRRLIASEIPDVASKGSDRDHPSVGNRGIILILWYFLTAYRN
jgi:hypothetical protein